MAYVKIYNNFFNNLGNTSVFMAATLHVSATFYIYNNIMASGPPVALIMGGGMRSGAAGPFSARLRTCRWTTIWIVGTPSGRQRHWDSRFCNGGQHPYRSYLINNIMVDSARLRRVTTARSSGRQRDFSIAISLFSLVHCRVNEQQFSFELRWRPCSSGRE